TCTGITSARACFGCISRSTPDDEGRSYSVFAVAQEPVFPYLEGYGSTFYTRTGNAAFQDRHPRWHRHRATGEGRSLAPASGRGPLSRRRARSYPLRRSPDKQAEVWAPDRF